MQLICLAVNGKHCSLFYQPLNSIENSMASRLFFSADWRNPQFYIYNIVWSVITQWEWDLGLNKKLRWLGKGGVSLYQGPTWEERMGRFSLFKSLPRLYSWSTCSSGIKSQKHLPQYLTAFPLMKHPPQPESSRWQTWTSLGSWRYCKPSPIPYDPEFIELMFLKDSSGQYSGKENPFDAHFRKAAEAAKQGKLMFIFLY